MSPAEYLALEKTSEVKHEYINGEAFAMAGGTPRHSAICANVGSALLVALRGRGRRVFQSDLRVHIPSAGMYTYADVAVVCGPVQPATADPHSVTNPRLIVEVLSSNTEAHDRGAKFKHYQSIESLEEYVLVSPDEQRVEVYRRMHGDLAAKGQWLLTTYSGGGIELGGRVITVDEIYAQLEDVPAE
jgi:Uma2 family endonuclease